MGDLFLADSFDDAEDSDVRLTFYAGVSNGKRAREEAGSSAAGPSKTFHVHKVVLKQSEFFKARLQRWWSEQEEAEEEDDDEEDEEEHEEGNGAPPTASSNVHQSKRAGGGRPPTARRPRQCELRVAVDAEDLEAAEQTARLLYTRSLPADLTHALSPHNAVLLLRTLRLSDMFGLPQACLDAAAAALCTLTAGHLNADLVSAALGDLLPQHLRDAANLAPLRTACQRWLVERFGDVPAVLENEALRGAFRALPLAAVLLWLRADDLRVHSENCVLLLLCVWVSGGGAAAEPAALEALAHGVRLLHLSASFMHSLLPCLGWYAACPGREHLRVVLIYRETGVQLVPGYPGPPGWVLPPRTRTIPHASVVLDLNLDESELPPLYAPHRPRLHSAATTYCNGMHLRLFAHVTHKPESAPACQWCVRVGIERDAATANARCFSSPAASIDTKSFYEEPFAFEAQLEILDGPDAKILAPFEVDVLKVCAWNLEWVASPRDAVLANVRRGRMHLRVTVRGVR